MSISLDVCESFEVLTLQHSGTESVRFAQEMQDYGSTGLYHIYARQMDPELGRFLSLVPRQKSV